LEDKTSPTSQPNHCRIQKNNTAEYCKKKEHSIVVYTEDEGAEQSSKNTRQYFFLPLFSPNKKQIK